MESCCNSCALLLGKPSRFLHFFSKRSKDSKFASHFVYWMASILVHHNNNAIRLKKNATHKHQFMFFQHPGTENLQHQINWDMIFFLFHLVENIFDCALFSFKLGDGYIVYEAFTSADLKEDLISTWIRLKETESFLMQMQLWLIRRTMGRNPWLD